MGKHKVNNIVIEKKKCNDILEQIGKQIHIAQFHSSVSWPQ